MRPLRIFVYCTFLLGIACVPNQPPPPGNAADLLAEIASMNQGLHFTVKNSLPQETEAADTSEGHQTLPDLKAYFCPVYSSRSDNPNISEDTTKFGSETESKEEPQDIGLGSRCIAFEEIIKNGAEEKFFISHEDLAKIYRLGNGEGIFKFIDNHKVMGSPFECYHGKIHLDPDSYRRQSWRVEVKQRQEFSYECLVDQL